MITQIDAFQRILGQCGQMRGTCLNAGCGEGLYSEFLESFQKITKIINVDLHSPSIAKQRADSRHMAISCSLTSLPFNDAAFDCCLCSEVIEHINEDSIAISELARVLKQGGILLLSVPTPPAPYDPAHVREGYTLKELYELLIGTGLTIKKHSYCFHISMRLFFLLWEWQFRFFGRSKRSYLPRFIIRLFGHADKYLKFGNPWDLIVLAKK